jgi:Ni/Co efflux regulator RcnB
MNHYLNRAVRGALLASALALPCAATAAEDEGALDARQQSEERNRADDRNQRRSNQEATDRSSCGGVIAMAESHCPLLDMMQRPVEITGEVKLNGKRLETTAEAAA